MTEEEVYPCPYLPAFPYKYGECYMCQDCDNDPKNYIPDEDTLLQFEETPWCPYCMTCGEFDSFANHPGHLVVVGYEEYREKVPQMIMNRILDKEGEQYERHINARSHGPNDGHQD